MKILVIGGGGREHALLWKLSRETERHELFCAPGNAGTRVLATSVPIAADDLPALVAWAQERRPDLTVIGPEVPLCAGVADAFAAVGRRVFGPSRAAAQMEGSKLFAKEIMHAAGVPTAAASSFTDAAAAKAALRDFPLPLVVKADGLAAGKGVVICATRREAEAAIDDMLLRGVHGAAGTRILLEEFLEGEEASLLALTDGERVALLPAAQDHKRVFDGDRGANTGGMGAYSPAPVITDDLAAAVARDILQPTIDELRRRGIVYRGVLYAGLMITRQGTRVLEFNCRFGDPETQVVLPRLQGDLTPLMEACIDGRLDGRAPAVRPDPCATVVLAAPGYPGSYPKGLPIEGLDAAAGVPNTQVFHSGTALREDGQVVTAGGRVLTVTAWGVTLRAAVDSAYAAVGAIRFQGMHYRRDIAHRALERPSF